MISKFLTHPILPPVEQVASDPQRSSVYKLEREVIGSCVHHRMSREHLKELMDHACGYYGVSPPKLVVYNKPDLLEFGSSHFSIYPDGRVGNHQIRLNRGFHGANAKTLLHEVAHHIADSCYPGHTAHGRKFAAIYMHLLDKYRILPVVAFRTLARKWGIKIARRYLPEHIGA